MSRLGGRHRVQVMRAPLVYLLCFLPSSALPQSQSRLWGSVGLGFSAIGTSAMVSATYSRGPALIMGRLDAAGAVISGESVDNRALLIGLRSRASSGFMVGAIGLGRARFTRRSSDTAPRRYPSGTGLAFELKGQGGGASTQLGMSMLGVLGPGQARYIAVVLSLNVGWFG